MENYDHIVDEIGEFGLIDRIKKLLPAACHNDLIIGIGDDTAVIRIDEQRALLITCDIQIENQHFCLKYITPNQLGRRAMAVNLSDIAAMGGKPTFALVSLGIPKSFSLSYFDDLFAGMRDQLAAFSASIVGGNLSRNNNGLIIDITLMGEIPIDELVTRRGARPGHRIYVTGQLGEAGAGLSVLQYYEKNYPGMFDGFVQKHLQPIPRIEAGRAIARSKFASAMIDISDGIASDLHHICTMSGVGAEIYLNKLPLPADLHKVESISKKSIAELTLQSGEDYELLFTAKSDISVSQIEAVMQGTGVSISEIGRIIPKEAGYHLIDSKGVKIPIHPRGWDHFRD